MAVLFCIRTSYSLDAAWLLGQPYSHWECLQWSVEAHWWYQWFALLRWQEGGQAISGASNEGFKQFINNFGLIDLGLQGHPYTWNNRLSGSFNIQKWLDRGITYDWWKILFPHATAIHLTTIHLDHKLLLFNSNQSPHPYPKPFWFEAMWLDHLDMSTIIREAWRKGTSLASKSKKTKIALWEWDKVVF